MDSGILENILKYKNLDMSSFHTPSHKNTNFLGNELNEFLKLDLTELEETDNLYQPTKSILRSETLASEIFQTKKTLFSAGGNTLCIQTMLRLCAPRREKILCARNVHKSAVSAMALLGVDPIWVLPEQKNSFGVTHGFSGELAISEVEKKLKSNRNVLGIFLTSPDYYGVVSDIKGLSRLSKKYKTPLLVDNAHGTHFKFLKEDIHPISLGADISADSAHKTLPVMTGGAFLHINNESLINDAKAAMALFGSTSPSFPILCSLDACCNFLKNNGKAAFSKLESTVSEIKQILANKNMLPNFKNSDPTRITIQSSKMGISGKNFSEYLKKFKINSELYDDHYVVLIPSPFNTERDWNRLYSALNNLDKSELYNKKQKIPTNEFTYFLPKKILSLREALFSKNIEINIDNAKNKILCEILCPAQPSIPPIMPGELLTEREILTLKSFGVKTVKVLK